METRVREGVQEALRAHENRTRAAREEEVERRVREGVRGAMRQCDAKMVAAAAAQRQAAAESRAAPQFPPEARKLFVGTATTPRTDFLNQLNSLGLGVPFHPDSEGNSGAILLYRDPSALPYNQSVTIDAVKEAGAPMLSVEQAAQNCDVVNVALLSTENSARTCYAFVAGGGPEGHHLLKFARLLPATPNVRPRPVLDPTAPLSLVGLFELRHSAPLPSKDGSKIFRAILSEYLRNFDAAMEKLSPIAAAAAVNKTIVVVTCNFGQSEILMNFVCGARHRQLDLSMVIVFAIDEETRDVALGLGLHTFYDERTLGFIPKEVSPFGTQKFGTVVSKAALSDASYLAG
jgi:hypothetical protein